jgi:hypothetical protein
MRVRTPLRLAVCALIFAALPATAALYKWIDENGRVAYGDTPPAGVKAERISTSVAPGDASAVRDMAAKDAQIKKRQQERTEGDTKAQKSQADAKAKLDRCVQIRGQLQGLRSEIALYHFNDNGERVYYTAVEREQAIADSEKQLRDLDCPTAPAG